MRPDPDEEWQRWVEWLGELGSRPSIADDVLAMLAARQIWDSFRLVYNNAPVQAQKMRTMISWVSEAYVHRQAMAIRRQTDTDRDVVSIARLIDRVRRYPDVLSRERYIARTEEWTTREEADRLFDSMIGVGRAYIDPNVARTELAKLRSKAKRVVDFADNEIAHYNREKGTFSVNLKFRDLHAAIDLMADLFVRYRNRILGTSTDPNVRMTEWIGIFSVPWIPDNDHWGLVAAKIREIEDKRRRGEALADDE